MNKDMKFIGFAAESDAKDTFTDSLWTPKILGSLPSNLITPSNLYMFTTASGFVSLPTVAYGVQYVSAIDNWRYEYNSYFDNEPFINIDHFVFHPYNSGYAVWQLPVSYHWPTLNDPIVQSLPNEYKYPILSVLKQKRK